MGCEKEKESCHYLASEGVLAFGPVQNAADHLCLTYTLAVWHNTTRSNNPQMEPNHMLVLFIGAMLFGFLGMAWLDPKHRGKARWNYSETDWINSLSPKKNT